MNPGNRSVGPALVAALLVLAVLGACARKESTEAAKRAAGITPPELAQKAKALYEERCRTVAGEKIYRTVPNVEGIVLLRVRPERTDKELADLMWPGAAFALESRGDGFINSFLGYEHSSSPEGKPVTPENRGYITIDRRSNSLPGYRYVDVIDATDRMRYRPKGSETFSFLSQ